MSWRWQKWLAAGLALAVVVAALGLAARAAEGDGPAQLLGRVTAVEADGAAFTLEAKGGPFRVLLADVLEVVSHTAVPLKDVEGGSGTLYLLAHWIREKPKGRPHVAQIAVMVWSADAFYPPPVTKDQTARQVEWISGVPKHEGGKVTVEAAYIDTPLDRPVIRVERAGKEAIAAGALVCLELRALPAGAKELKPERVVITAPKVPIAETRLAIGM